MNSDMISRKQTTKFESNLFNPNRDFVNPEVMTRNQVKPLTILIIDSHRLFADGICTLLREHKEDIQTKYLSEVPTSYEQLKAHKCAVLSPISSLKCYYKLLQVYIKKRYEEVKYGRIIVKFMDVLL